MKTLVVKIPERLEKRLARLEKKSGKSADVHLREALEERIRDMEDYYSAVETLKKVESGEMSVRTLDEWKEDYDRRHQMED